MNFSVRVEPASLAVPGETCQTALALLHGNEERRGHERRLGFEGALPNDRHELALPILLELEHAPRLPVLGTAGPPGPLLGNERPIMAAQRPHLAMKLPPRAVLVGPELATGAALQQPERPGPRGRDRLGIRLRNPRELLGSGRP